MAYLTPSGGDDTAQIQAALDTKGYAELDSGTFLVSSLNLTDRQGPALIGRGSLNTKLNPIQSGVNVIDCTGTTNPLLRDFRIAGTGAGVTPNTGILTAQKAGSAGADVFALEGVRVDGNFGVAAFYCFGTQSSRVIGGQFYNYQPGGMAAILTGANNWGVQSAFTQIRTANDMNPSDWVFVASEFHNLASGWAAWFGGVTSAKFYGGNFSSSAPIVSNNAVAMSYGTQYPSNVVMDGVTFYSDFAPTAPYAVSGLTDPNQGYMVFRSCTPVNMPMTGP